jgi:hypothetical protein
VTDTEQRVEWAPAIPAAFATFLVGVFVWPAAVVLTLVAAGGLVVRARRRQWTALTFACVGVLAGAVLLTLFVLAERVLGGSA